MAGSETPTQTQATKVVTKGGWSRDGNLYQVETGRRDGRVSRAKEAVKNLPDSMDGIRKLIRRFASKNLSVKDLAVLSGTVTLRTLLPLIALAISTGFVRYTLDSTSVRTLYYIYLSSTGAHAIGKSHCPSIAKRLRNFTAHRDSDPTLDAAYAAELRRQCRRRRDNTTELEMVPGSSTAFGTAYYGLVAERRALFHSDEALLRNGETRALVYRYRDAPSEAPFLADFGASMLNMGRVGVLTGAQGEIRKRCAFVN